jgi:predicted peptidase
MRSAAGILLVVLVSWWPARASYAQSASTSRGSSQSGRELVGETTRAISTKYLLHVPADYSKDRRWPVIVYLHGGSLRGTDVERIRTLGLARRLEGQPSFPFIVISPLCPPGEIWTDVEAIIGILDAVQRDYVVDRDRVYVTGHSMGGRGALYLAFKYPDRFAAVVAMSAVSPISAWSATLSRIPIWYFHGVKDRDVPIADGDALVEAVKAAGGNIRYTRLEDADHALLDTYFRRDWHEWLLEHTRGRAVGNER